MRMTAFGVVAVVVAVVVTLILSDPDVPPFHPNIRESTWGDRPWPLTVVAGILSCTTVSGGGEAVFFEERDGTVWPLNGMARQVHLRYGAEPAVDPIWRPNPEIPGTRISIGPLVALGRTYCG